MNRSILVAALGTLPFIMGGADSASTATVRADLARTDHVVEVNGGAIHAWEVTQQLAEDSKDAASPVVVFLHGGTWSGRPNFDLRFEDYSTMEHFARRGWDTFAVDARGYGRSSQPHGENWAEAADVVKDLRAVVEHIIEQRPVERVHLIGWSWGSQVAALFAQTHPELTARVVLYGTRWQAYGGAPAAPTERFRTSTIEDAKSDFIEGCFDPKLVDVYSKAAIAADPESPNGVYRDYYENLPIIEPKKLSTPTLIIAGEHEATHSMEDIAALFQAISTQDKQLAVIPGGGHAVHLENGRHRWRATVLAFLGQASGD